jgi:hypothetical protein
VPGQSFGTITGADITAAQDFMAAIVQREGLPPKVLFIHQYLDDTVVDGHDTRMNPSVDLVLNMDAFGPVQGKHERYQAFSTRPYAQHLGYNVFLRLDERILSEEELMQLSPQPDVVFYQ